MEWINVNDKLPEHGQFVLAWAGNVHQPSMCTVVRFLTGISKVERKELEENGDKRAKQFYAEDEGGNNKRPYCWEEFGPMKWFGQDVTYWMPLPQPPQ